MERITKNTVIKDARDMLESHMIPLSYGWEMVISMMLNDCDYITVDGTGSNAKLVKHIIKGEEE